MQNTSTQIQHILSVYGVYQIFVEQYTWSNNACNLWVSRKWEPLPIERIPRLHTLTGSCICVLYFICSAFICVFARNIFKYLDGLPALVVIPIQFRPTLVGTKKKHSIPYFNKLHITYAVRKYFTMAIWQCLFELDSASPPEKFVVLSLEKQKAYALHILFLNRLRKTNIRWHVSCWWIPNAKSVSV